MPEEKNNNKKQTARELIESSYPKMAQETIKNFTEQREKILNIIKPTLERMETIRQSFIVPEGNEFILKNYRSTESLILDELRELNKKQSSLKTISDSDILIIYDTSDSSLNRNINGKYFSYDLSEDGKRKKLLDILNDKKKYVKTDELRNLLDCPTNQAVAKIVQTFNDYATNALRLKNIKMIQGKKGSGYRINPKIVLEIENS